MPLTFVHMVTGETTTAQPWQEALRPGDRYLLIADDLVVIGEILETAEGYGAGFFWVRGYSVECPQGEEGLFCCADANAPLTPEQFAAMLAEIQA